MLKLPNKTSKGEKIHILLSRLASNGDCTMLPQLCHQSLLLLLFEKYTIDPLKYEIIYLNIGFIIHYKLWYYLIFNFCVVGNYIIILPP